MVDIFSSMVGQLTSERPKPVHFKQRKTDHSHQVATYRKAMKGEGKMDAPHIAKATSLGIITVRKALKGILRDKCLVKEIVIKAGTSNRYYYEWVEKD